MRILNKDEYTSEIKTTFSEAMFLSALASKVLSYLLYKTHIHFIVSDDRKYSTAFVDKNRNLYINSDFWVRLPNDKQRAFVLLHEVLHIWFQHLPRAIKAKWNLQAMNIAADHFNNLMLLGHLMLSEKNPHAKDEKMQKYIEVPEWCYQDSKYVGMDLQTIYDDVIKNIDDNDKSKGGSGGETLEDMSDWGDTDEDSINSDEVKDALAGAQAYAASTGSIGKDSLDSMLRHEIDKIIEAEIDYRSIINNLMASAGEDIPTYNYPSNRADDDICLPTYTGEKVHLVIGIDTSGSMTNYDFQDAASAILAAMKQFEAWDITLLTCDTKPHVIGFYSEENGDDIFNIDLKLIGGGGTNMSPLAQYARDLVSTGDELSACIIITDGHIPVDVDSVFEDSIDNIVIVTKNGNKSLELENATIVNITD